MAIVTIYSGRSSVGKTHSTFTFQADDVGIIQTIKKQLGMRRKPNGTYANGFRFRDDKGGNIVVCGHINAQKAGNQIVQGQKFWVEKMVSAGRKVIIVDDFGYTMSTQLLDSNGGAKGGSVFEKYTAIASETASFITFCSQLPDDVRVYIIMHDNAQEDGSKKLQLVGKLLEEKIVLEGMVPNWIHGEIANEQYVIRIRGNGAKSPHDMCPEPVIPNDLQLFDSMICEYNGIEPTQRFDFQAVPVAPTTTTTTKEGK